MPQDPVDFSANTNATIDFTFTPHAGGFAYLSGASLTDETTQKYTPLKVTGNTATFQLPAGESFVQVAVVDGPRPETGALSYTINGGASTVLWPDNPTRPLAGMPGAFYGYGN